MLVRAQLKEVNMDVLTSRQCNGGLFRPFQGRGASASRPAILQRRTLVTRAADQKKGELYDRRSSTVWQKELCGGYVRSCSTTIVRLSDHGLSDAESQSFGEKAGGVVQKVQEALDEIDDNVLAYCNLDKKTVSLLTARQCRFLCAKSWNIHLQGGKRLKRMTLGEKEQEFLAAMSVRFFLIVHFLCYLALFICSVLPYSPITLGKNLSCPTRNLTT